MITRMMSGCVLVAGLLVFAGCNQQEPAPAPDAPEGGASAPADSAEPEAVVVTPEMAEILVKADALDGNADKTVTLCAACALGMDGSPDHTLAVGEYTMHFCSADCKGMFSEDTAVAVAGITVPEASEGGDAQMPEHD